VRFRSLFFLAFAATSALAQAPATPQPDGRRLRLTRDSLEIFFIRLGQPQRTGFLIDRLDTVRVNGETLLRRVCQTTDAVLGSRVDTLTDVLAALQPRMVRSRADRGTERLDWGPTRVTGVVEEPDGPSRAVNSPLPSGWYSSASFDLILRASPLAEGYRITVPTFSGREGSQVLTAQVVGSEDVPGHGDTWRIEADFAGLPVTFWISKTSRRLVQQVMHVSPGLEIMFVAARASSSA
jgi:hypothetical protein